MASLRFFALSIFVGEMGVVELRIVVGVAQEAAYEYHGCLTNAGLLHSVADVR